jgi:hypothetical protein
MKVGYCLPGGKDTIGIGLGVGATLAIGYKTPQENISRVAEDKGLWCLALGASATGKPAKLFSQSSDVDSSMFERPVRPRKEDEELDVSSAASAEDETSGNENEAAPRDLSNVADSEIERESGDEDVSFFTRYVRYDTALTSYFRRMQPPTTSQKI